VPTIYLDGIEPRKLRFQRVRPDQALASDVRLFGTVWWLLGFSCESTPFTLLTCQFASL
jgi:hypothetical protein